MIEIICSWKTLFTLARAEGDARIKLKNSPTEENQAAYNAAAARHEQYRDLCLKADKIIF